MTKTTIALLLYALPWVALAQFDESAFITAYGSSSGGGGLTGIVAAVVRIFNQLVPVLAALGIVFFMVGVIKYIRSEGEHTNRDAMLWSLIALFVLFSVWGILRIVCSTLIGTSSCGTPASNSTGVDGYFGETQYQNNLPFGGPR